MNTLDQLRRAEETVWLNPDKQIVREREKINGHGFVEVKAAQSRFMRFLPYIAKVFPETADKKGVIESSLLEIPAMASYLRTLGAPDQGRILLKDDAHLPIAGSVKARGGIHEVLKIAEQLAVRQKLMMPTDNHEIMTTEPFRDFYSQYTIQAGSTGNLGLSIGIMAASFGFHVIIHMSCEAKEWKKQLLRDHGVTVMEYEGDYAAAVAAGREKSKEDPNSFFVDDENSEDLFFGYATAGMRLKVQLYKNDVSVDSDHPLFVYLPCGVGGAPGGIAYGLKQMFGDYVHCFFAEPVAAPCMTLGLASGKLDDICVQDIGLSGKTAADGLAVGRPSGFSARMMQPLLSGAFTVSDEHMISYMKKMWELEGIFLEPSACAGFMGVTRMGEEAGRMKEYLKKWYLTDVMEHATHVIWATGGGLVPKTEQKRLLES